MLRWLSGWRRPERKPDGPSGPSEPEGWTALPPLRPTFAAIALTAPTAEFQDSLAVRAPMSGTPAGGHGAPEAVPPAMPDRRPGAFGRAAASAVIPGVPASAGAVPATRQGGPSPGPAPAVAPVAPAPPMGSEVPFPSPRPAPAAPAGAGSVPPQAGPRRPAAPARTDPVAMPAGAPSVPPLPRPGRPAHPAHTDPVAVTEPRVPLERTADDAVPRPLLPRPTPKEVNRPGLPTASSPAEVVRRTRPIGLGPPLPESVDRPALPGPALEVRRRAVPAPASDSAERSPARGETPADFAAQADPAPEFPTTGAERPVVGPLAPRPVMPTPRPDRGGDGRRAAPASPPPLLAHRPATAQPWRATRFPYRAAGAVTAPGPAGPASPSRSAATSARGSTPTTSPVHAQRALTGASRPVLPDDTAAPAPQAARATYPSSAPARSEPSPASAPVPRSAPAPAPAPPGAIAVQRQCESGPSQAEPAAGIDEIVSELYERISSKLRSELLVDRERSGRLIDA